MADLFDRMFGEDNDIAVHYFRGALGDYSGGGTSRAEIITMFSLDLSAELQLDSILNEIDSLPPGGPKKSLYLLELHDVFLLAEAGLKYNTLAEFEIRLGL